MIWLCLAYFQGRYINLIVTADTLEQVVEIIIGKTGAKRNCAKFEKLHRRILLW
jgi:hypothetical protein